MTATETAEHAPTLSFDDIISKLSEKSNKRVMYQKGDLPKAAKKVLEGYDFRGY